VYGDIQQLTVNGPSQCQSDFGVGLIVRRCRASTHPMDRSGIVEAGIEVHFAHSPWISWLYLICTWRWLLISFEVAWTRLPSEHQWFCPAVDLYINVIPASTCWMRKNLIAFHRFGCSILWSNLSNSKPLHPIIMLTIDKWSQVLLHTSISSFRLAISLRVDSCWHSSGNS